MDVVGVDNTVDNDADVNGIDDCLVGVRGAVDVDDAEEKSEVERGVGVEETGRRDGNGRLMMERKRDDSDPKCGWTGVVCRSASNLRDRTQRRTTSNAKATHMIYIFEQVEKGEKARVAAVAVAVAVAAITLSP